MTPVARPPISGREAGASSARRVRLSLEPATRRDPAARLDVWRLHGGELLAYEAGFRMGWSMRQDEVDRAEAAADRYYREAYDRRDQVCGLTRPRGRRATAARTQ